MSRMQIASVYVCTNGYIIHPQSRTTMGLWIACEPVCSLTENVSPETLGSTIQSALNASKVGVEHPTDWKALLKPLLECAKVRSWNAIQKSAKLCQVETNHDGIRIVPNKNGGTSGPEKGYQSLDEKAIVLPRGCSAESLGNALMVALDLCC